MVSEGSSTWSWGWHRVQTFSPPHIPLTASRWVGKTSINPSVNRIHVLNSSCFKVLQSQKRNTQKNGRRCKKAVNTEAAGAGSSQRSSSILSHCYFRAQSGPRSGSLRRRVHVKVLRSLQRPTAATGARESRCVHEKQEKLYLQGLVRAFGINSILYQRGIYPPETFTRVTHYDMSLQLTTDSKLKNYLTNVVSQLKEWLFECTVQKFVLVITCLETNEVLERWQFDIECDKSAKEISAPRDKSIKTIQDEIRSVIRQITATVTFLPLLETPCAFDLLVYTDKDLMVPDKWEESGPQIIDQSEEVRLRSFTTSIHKVNSMVAYKRTDLA